MKYFIQDHPLSIKGIKIINFKALSHMFEIDFVDMINMINLNTVLVSKVFFAHRLIERCKLAWWVEKLHKY